MATVVQFSGPRRVEVVVTEPEPLPPGHVRVRTRYSGISAGTELIPGQLEKRPPHAVLRDAESRLDEEAERHRRVGFDPHVDAALTFDHSSEKPAALLLARQAFLLIACTGRIVTHSTSLPRGQDGECVPPDTQVSQHIARFCNRPKC